MIDRAESPLPSCGDPMSVASITVHDPETHWVGAGEACQLLGVHVSTLRQWTDQGRLRAFLTPGGHRRYREVDLQAFRGGPPQRQLRRSLAAAILTMQPRCGFSRAGTMSMPDWLTRCDETTRQRPRLLGGALARLLARYLTSDDVQAARCLAEALEDAAEYGILAATLGLTPAKAVEAFTVCRAPILETAQRWATESVARGSDATDELARVGHFFDETLLSMLAALERVTSSSPTGS
jgi:excisionase family DNA binding protein